ncbi:hypothetical protein FB451DRAFT_1374002 [Mycena latifolia]|nr:hypothetical protein FB451DRAFT_1374002 [Mycena latifolia]
MSLKSLLISLVGCATLVLIVLFPPELHMITAILPAVSIATLPILGYKLLKRFFSGGGVPDISAHSNTVYYYDTNEKYTTRIWTNTTHFVVRTPRSTAAIEGPKHTQLLQGW